MNNRQQNDNTESKRVDRSELISVNQRLQNVEKIANTIDNVAGKALESWQHYLDQKNEQEKREIENHNIQNKRAIQVLVISLILIFIMVMFAMFKEQYDIVKIILGSYLALAAGAGIATNFRTKK